VNAEGFGCLIRVQDKDYSVSWDSDSGVSGLEAATPHHPAQRTGQSRHPEGFKYDAERGALIFSDSEGKIVR